MLHIYKGQQSENKQDNDRNATIHSDISENQNCFASDVPNLSIEGTCKGTCGTTVSEEISTSTQVLLATAIVYVNNEKTGKTHQCRALLDSGSMSNFISQNLCQKLNLKIV